MALVTVDISSYVNFRTDVLGRGFDVDGVYGYQCVDMAKLLAGNAGRPSPYWKSDPDGYARSGWIEPANREYNASDYFSLIYSKGDVRIGDLVVLNSTSSNPYGHIAFANSDWTNDQTTAILLGQNQVDPNPSTGHVNTLTELNVTTFLGAFRFNAWTPTPLPSAKKHFPWVLRARKLNQMRNQL